MGLALSKNGLKVCIFIAALAFLSACSPKLNWRTVQSPEQGYSALFPAEPDKLERHISFQDQDFLQTLEAAKVEDDIYSISAIQIPENEAAAVKQVIALLQSNLIDRAKAAGGVVVVEDVLYRAGQRQGLPTKDYFITFASNGKAKQAMRVRWITRLGDKGNSWVYQISILHAASDAVDAKTFLSQEDYTNFFNEFYPE